MSMVTDEIATQPDVWARVLGEADVLTEVLPQAGQRVALIGCGTSFHIARAYASLRETLGHGETDAFAAAEAPLQRSYDVVVALSRSGTTTEILDQVARCAGRIPTVAITTSMSVPLALDADHTIALDFADERAVVQTRFATTALSLLRRHLGQDLTATIADARRAIDEDPPAAALAADQITFLGMGWAHGLAEEAALKLRESAGAWAEAYPAMEYRHGPISIAQPGRCVWVFGPPPSGLVDDIRRTGADLILGELDPQAELVRAQRVAAALAVSRGMNPDQPRHLSRAVILPAG